MDNQLVWQEEYNTGVEDIDKEHQRLFKIINKLLAVSLNRTLAKSRHIPAALLENLFAVLTALIVMLSIKWVGILIINALLILPAASSRNISGNMREYHLFSLVFSIFSGIMGLIVSYYANIATGPTIVIIASIIYFATYLWGRKYNL
jgi:zinc transport system permease protein